MMIDVSVEGRVYFGVAALGCRRRRQRSVVGVEIRLESQRWLGPPVTSVLARVSQRLTFRKNHRYKTSILQRGGIRSDQTAPRCAFA
jgi:hypothetical protein